MALGPDLRDGLSPPCHGSSRVPSGPQSLGGKAASRPGSFPGPPGRRRRDQASGDPQMPPGEQRGCGWALCSFLEGYRGWFGGTWGQGGRKDRVPCRPGSGHRPGEPQEQPGTNSRRLSPYRDSSTVARTPSSGLSPNGDTCLVRLAGELCMGSPLQGKAPKKVWAKGRASPPIGPAPRPHGQPPHVAPILK